jgi:hypothetical protein
VVVTDAGFKGPFFQAVREMSWDFVGRIRGTAKAFAPDGAVVSKDHLYAGASTVPTALGTFGLFISEPIPCSLVLVRGARKPGPKRPPPKRKEDREYRQGAIDPWLLATSMPDADPAHVVSLYAKRMQIEETFRDTKNYRFGWALCFVKRSSPQRVAALLVLACLAMVVVTLIGMAAEDQGAHRAYQANTERRRVLSFFVLASAILRKRDFSCLSPPAIQAALASISVRASA